MLIRIFTLLALTIFAVTVSAHSINRTVNSKETYIDDSIKIVYDQKTAVMSVYTDPKAQEPTYNKYFLTGQILEEIRIYKNKLLLQFDIINNDIFYIIDLDSREIIDKFRGFFSAISPNNRYVIFKKWQARNETSKYGRPGGVSMLYDLTLSPRENRTDKELSKLKKNNDLVKNHVHAGHPVYPIQNKDSPSYGWITESKDNYHVNNYYIWQSNNEVIFALLPKKDSTTLVQVLLNDKKAPVVNEYDVSQLNQMHIQRGRLSSVDIVSIKRIGGNVKLRTNSHIVLIIKMPLE